MPNPLDALLFGIRTLFQDAKEFPARSAIRFTGATLTDNQAENLTEVLMAGGPPSGTAGGDLEGSYPDPTIKSLAPVSGILEVDAHQVDTFPNDAATSSTSSRVSAATTVNAGVSELRRFNTFINAAQCWDMRVVATHHGNGAGVGCIVDSWTGWALVSRDPADSTSALIIASFVSPAAGSSGWAGPSWAVDTGTGFVVLNCGGAGGAGTVLWTASSQIVTQR